MSKHNKANKNNYIQAGRLTPDEMARERMNQARAGSHPRESERVIGKKQHAGQASSPRRTEREEEG